jgi:hypothetical protein
MFDDFRWRRGSGELGVIDKVADLARKASEEAGAEVMVVINFPQATSTWSPPLHNIHRSKSAHGRHKPSLRDWFCCANG